MIRHTGSTKKKFLLIYLEKEFYLQEGILRKILCLCPWGINKLKRKHNTKNS
jgi:hypothetical protein